jgi:hypothetical protein
MSDVIEIPNRGSNRRRAALLFAVLLIASAILGAVVDRYVFRAPRAIIGDTGFHPLSAMLRSPTDAERRQIRSELARELDLDPQQDSAVSSIMKRNASEFQALRDELRPRVEALTAHVRVQVDSVLTPAQRERFHQLQARQRASSAVQGKE